MERYSMWRLAAWKGVHDVDTSGMERYSMWRLAVWKGIGCGG